MDVGLPGAYVCVYMEIIFYLDKRKCCPHCGGKPQDVENIHNARVAAEYINGTILKPGEASSFNEVVGPRTLDRGFVVGHNAAYQPDLGSGICREATVLNQLVKNIGMTVTERETHFPPIDYADPDNDAAIVWGYCDLKFINTLPC